jgi:DNA-binding SARP family transcriptional activator/TolB-like protein
MIELRTLGALELTSSDSRTVSSVLAQPRRAALLCYLALAEPRGFHRRDTLFPLFWPENDAGQARHALRQAVYFLRRALGAKAIVSRGDEEVALGGDEIRCDVWEFESALSQGRTVEALALYKGELLAGFHVSDAPEFERWLEAQRARLRERAEEGAWALAAARQQEGDAAGAAEAARRAVALAPTDEIALRRLVLLLESVGDRAAAVRAYEAFTRKLREEYELEPSTETQVLVARIRAEPAGRPIPPLRLETPAPPEPVVVPAPPPPPPPPAPGSGRRVIGVVFAVLLLALGGILARTWTRIGTLSADSLPTSAPAPAIAVLPFVSQDDALANWREGLMDLVSMDLSGVPGLRAVDNRTVLARWREAVVGRDAPTLATALDVAERAGGRYAVEGHVIADGNDLVLTASVHEVAGHRLLGVARSRGSADSIFAVVDRLTLEILRIIPGSDARQLARIDMARVNTASLAALKAFLEGEALFRQSHFEDAAEAYGRAVEADSTFALARYRLGLSRQWFWSDFVSSSSDPLAPAIGRFAGRLPEHEAAMLRAFELRSEDVSAARTLLQEELRRHPEDADSWYQLGELYYHSGAEVLMDPGEADRALARAMALDSTFSLPYVHRIEYAINARDATATNRMLGLFARFAPDSRHLFQLRLLAGLLLGDPRTRATSAAALDTLPVDRLVLLGFQLAAASRWDLSERAFRVARNRPQHPPVASIALFYTSLVQGRIREARRWMADPYTLPSRKPRMLHTLSMTGVPASTADLDQLLPRGAADTLDAMQLFYLGAIAADQGRVPVGQEMLERLRARARRTATAEDSTEATLAKALQQALEGYQAWRRGQRDVALRLIQEAQRHAHGGQNINDMLRWWLGRLQVEMGHPREALPYFESLALSMPPSNYERARVYEQLGMAAQAREAYALFLTPRQQADSLVPSLNQKSREALARLDGGAR